ncbi:trifunctional serine/threonine-protein kinase/ATP-binding protein/sensor histidine kinase [Dapis sp. BLCC M229]|uniref:trifunctional serine/threonine-protein kinase/ATP-binding protein/sensor histidine kinase n=1 Tax=Dapis sp. BLCC M229 TaxID=3400188 RepID=UPI003CF08907
MLNLPNYYLSENLYQGTRTLVYRGQRNWDNKPVIIKVLRNLHPSFNELVQFRNQHIITRNLEHPAIVKPLALERYGNGYALIMPDSGAYALSDYWPKSEPSLTNFLHIAIQLAEVLHYLSIQRIIHKDIKPSNILIDPETKEVQLIDFSISTLLPKEQQQLISPNVLEGTLAYISPEQTGRMNRGIDYRTDFYSLGVTFFELLTGKLPFESSDPMELVHCHIAKTPPNPDSQLPTPLVDLVLKLMAKNAEDRYQSALGLKHDLEQCLQQLETTGKITQFELGSRDFCDRFLIPEKLYGRETEVQRLLDGFALVTQGATLMMLVAGFSGIGKTAVVNEVHKPIVKQRGYFIKGKFDQFNRNIPFSAFVIAFRDLIGQLLGESDTELAAWKSKILDAVGENGQVIIDVVPEVERIIGTQPAVTDLSGSAAQNRFNLLFSKFLRVFTTKEHPLVIFLDDLQWADSASLDLLKLLMEESEVGYLLVLGAYRDNEVFPAHPLMLSLDQINKQGAQIETLTLAPLSEKDITRLVAETLICTTELAAPLSELVYQKTKGNPFFGTQFLKGLHEDGCIQFNMEAGYWQCDMSEVRQLALTDDVVEFMVGRLQKLPEANQNVMKLAACIGNQFDLSTLAVVCEQTQDEVAGNLWRALQEGFVIPQTDTYKFFQGESQQGNSVENISVNYRFLHDRVQQAAYALIQSGQKQATHLQIGRLLSQNLSPEEQDSNIFTIVNHWNQAIELIADPAEQDYLIQLNLKSGEKAKGSAAYGAALQYFQTALSLLDVESWQRNYVLTLKLHENYAEVAYLTGDFELMETIFAQVIERGQNLLDLVKVHEIKIHAKMAQAQQLSALKIGIDFLALLGIEVSESPKPEDLQVELAAICQLMEGKAIATLADLPMMKDRKQLAKVNILTNLLSACYQAQPSLFPWVVCKLMQLSIKYGNTLYSAQIYSSYGMVCILGLQDFTSATEYGKLACQLDLNPQTGDGVGTFATGACIKHLSTHLKEAIPILLNAYQAGLDTGNFQFGGVSIAYRSQYLYLMGHNLSAMKLEMASASHALATMKQGNTLTLHQPFEQAVLNLLGESETPWELIGTAYNETESVPLKIAANNRPGLHFVYLNKLILCYLFDRIPQAVENAALAESYLDGVAACLAEYLWNLYDSLTQLAHYGDAETSVQKSILEKVETNQSKMQYWANHAPMNGQHKVDLVAAERHRILGERFQAIELYDRAITGAKENEYLQEEAVANELAAKFYLDWGKEKVAAGYMQEAYYCYARWEAKAKINQLEEKYPQLLSPILEKREPHNFHNSFTSTQVSDIVTTTTVFLDYASAIKASRAISEEIELDTLLCKFMQLLIENAGANKGVLLLNNSNNWEIVAQFNNETCDLSTTPVAESKTLPSSIINTVKRTQKTLLLNNNFEQNNTFSADPYLLKQQPKSLLCIPIINQGKLMGLLYLENNLTTEAFTPERIEVLKMLTAQAAISIENARLYQDLEAKVEQRTQNLQQTLQKLQQTQAQLIQTEKMSSLGQMIAGIAHEINNPITFISGNITHAREYFLDLLELLNLYQENLSAPSAAIEEKLQELELDFLCEDIEKIFDSMETGSTRIRQIILGLRNFSRLDEQGMKRVNIHEGLENTLMILQHRLRGSGSRPNIAIIKDYAQLPLVNCYASQLNQVFLQILTNAIDALTTSKAPDCPEIRIATQMQNQDNIRISIADNGPGMSKTVEQRIFDPFFTTKPVGQGTGLGLFISYQIVTEQHRGKLQCISQPEKGTKFMIDIPI